MVSIQLIAPASGAQEITVSEWADQHGFHSTDCPSEWGSESTILKR